MTDYEFKVLTNCDPKPDCNQCQFKATSENSLTTRELEILHLMAKGLKNQEIANNLAIQPQTVKNHIHDIFHKIKVRNRTEAVRFALVNNLVKLKEE